MYESFVTNCFPKWLYYITVPLAMYESFRCSTPSTIHDLVNVFNFYHSDAFVIFHCTCNLHFPDDKWCWEFFHVLVFHLCIFFVEVSVQIFCPVLYCVVFFFFFFYNWGFIGCCEDHYTDISICTQFFTYVPEI